MGQIPTQCPFTEDTSVEPQNLLEFGIQLHSVAFSRTASYRTTSTLFMFSQFVKVWWCYGVICINGELLQRSLVPNNM